jgi:hypothetical protein
MNRLFHPRMSLPVLIGAAVLCCARARADVADFENLPLAPSSHGPEETVPGVSFTSGGLTFNNHYLEVPWPSWHGWTYSNMTDTTTPGFGNQYSASTSIGYNNSAKYGVAYCNVSSLTSPPPTITAAQNQNAVFQSAYFTNTTYAYLSMRDGDQFAKKFGGPNGTDPDWFKLTISGWNAASAIVGAVEVYLADFRAPSDRPDNPIKSNYILNQWRRVDLAGFGSEVRRVSLELSSTDNDPLWGMNTPAYVAMDSISWQPAGQGGGTPPDLQNDAALTLMGGSRELGDVSGAGTLTVRPGTTLTANFICQDTLTLEGSGPADGARVIIRPIATGGTALPTPSGGSQVPEPGALALLLSGTLLMALRFRGALRCQSIGTQMTNVV